MIRKMLLVLCFATAFGSVVGETYKWSGGGAAGDWNDPLNWSPTTGCPNSGDTAVFGTPGTITITSAIALNEGTLNLQLVAGVTNIFSGVISGSGGISATGANGTNANRSIGNLVRKTDTWESVVRFSAANTFSGGLSGSYVSLEGWNVAAFGAANSTVSIGGKGWLGFCAAGTWRSYSYVIDDFTPPYLSVYFAETVELHGSFSENGITGDNPRLFFVSASSSPNVTIHGDINLPSIGFAPNIYSSGKHLEIDGVLTAKSILGGSWVGNAIGYTWLAKPGNSYGNAQIGYSVQIKCLAANVLDECVPILWQGYRSGNETTGNIDLYGFNQKALALSTASDSYTTADSFLRNTSATAATLTLEGATEDYLANCAIIGPLSIVWNPETSVTQTVNGIKNHTMSRGITVSNGTFRILGTATFAQVPSIDIASGASFLCAATTAGALAGVSGISIGAGGSFVVGDSAANPFTSATAALVIDSAAEIAVPAGMTLSVATLVVGGVAYEAGTYSSDPSAANYLPQLKGGSMTVASMIEVPTVEATWTGGGTRVEDPSDADNWSWASSGVPPLTSSSLYPLFASAGSRVVFDGDVDFKGIRFSGASDRFDIAGQGRVTVRSLGMTLDASRTNRIDAPVRYLGAQKWTVGTGSVLEIGGGISDTGGGAELMKDGEGTLLLSSPSTFTGPFTIGDGSSNCGIVRVATPTNAFGLASDYPITINSINSSRPAQGVLHMACTTGTCYVERPVVFKTSNVEFAFRSDAYTTNVFTKPIVADGTLRFFFDKFSEVICLGGGTFGGWTCFSGDNRGKWIFREKPASFNHLYVPAGARLHLEVASNHVGGIEFPTSSASEIFADVPFALTSTATTVKFAHANSRLNISGGDQRVGNFALMTAGGVTSSVPAVLEFTQTADITNSGVYFLGAAGLFKKGPGRIEFPHSQASSGAVGVGEGELAFTDGATWSNSTNITVNGTGVLEISSSNTFSPNCEMHISDGGKIRIGSGVVQKVYRLYIDGRPVGKRGLYGGAESSGNKRYADYFEGCGLLEVKGCGTWCMSFR